MTPGFRASLRRLAATQRRFAAEYRQWAADDAAAGRSTAWAAEADRLERDADFHTDLARRSADSMELA